LSQTHVASEPFRILVVEDEPDVQSLIRIMLQMHPRFRVAAEATSAAEADHLAGRCAPALVLLDHALQGPVSGLEAAPRIRERAPAAKILLFSAFDLDAPARTEPAVDGFLAKQHITDLVHVMESMLE
jgi:DNA-binding NarL/FixJ family response regulator